MNFKFKLFSEKNCLALAMFCLSACSNCVYDDPIESKTAKGIIYYISKTSADMAVNNGPVIRMGKKVNLWSDVCNGFTKLPQDEMTLFMIYLLSQNFMDGERASITRLLARDYETKYPNVRLADAIKSCSPKIKISMIKKAGGTSKLLKQRIKWLEK